MKFIFSISLCDILKNNKYEIVMKANVNPKQKEKITRKEALKKAGKYAAFTAAAAIVLLSPKEAQAGSPPPVGRGSRYGG